MPAKVEEKTLEGCFLCCFCRLFQKKYRFSAFISRKSVFLPDIINEVIKKGL
jgi:hypothetical protein